MNGELVAVAIAEQPSIGPKSVAKATVPAVDAVAVKFSTVPTLMLPGGVILSVVAVAATEMVTFTFFVAPEPFCVAVTS